MTCLRIRPPPYRDLTQPPQNYPDEHRLQVLFIIRYSARRACTANLTNL
jgi:hypothetical protein